MGRPMALNLARGGHQLVVYDQQPAATTQLVAAGARVGSGPAEIAQETDVVFTSLPTLAAVETVFLGEEGLVSSARPGQVLVDLSTILPSLAKRVRAAAAARGVETLDAPVSGGTGAARDGTLTIMVGGEEQIFQQVIHLLKLIGSNIFYMGPSGSGTLVKLINQLFMAVNNAGVLEGMALAARTGVDMDKMMRVISLSSGNSRVFELRAARIRNRDFEAGASVDIVAKDVELVLALAEELGAEVPMARQAKRIYEIGKERGLGAKDIAAIVEYFEKA